MKFCPCGCMRPAKTPQGWGGRGCSLRMIPREVRVARAKAYVQAHPEQFREAGRKGNRAWRPRRWNDLLDKWAELAREKGPSYALHEAYRRGFHSGYLSGRKCAGKREQAA